MSAFNDYMTQWQLGWRKSQQLYPGQKGFWQGKFYPWILPKEHQWETVYQPIRTPLQEYLKLKQVSHHTGIHNLKSSWVQCVNTYFLFGLSPEGKALLALFLDKQVKRLSSALSVSAVEDLELEYAETGPLSPEELLGEYEGSRGKNQTSPDIGVIARDSANRPILFLIENKLTEHSFYECSAWKHKGSRKRKGNSDSSRCQNMELIKGDIRQYCQQDAWGRKYWSILHSHRSMKSFSKLSSCPAMRAGYQLFRQHALAEGIAQSGKYHQVYSCIALDDRNDTLIHSMRSTDIEDVRHDWSTLWTGKTRFFTFSHQDWVGWVKQQKQREWDNWIEYVVARYNWEEQP